jgi:branched-chain amino acid transport system permease protein
VFFALQELLADYGSAYLIALGVFTMVIVLLAPRGLWGLVVARWPVALVAIDRRLVARSAESATSTEGA